MNTDTGLSVSVIGLGFVGTAMFHTFRDKGMLINTNLFGYDKYKSQDNSNPFDSCLNTNIMFLALPTQYNHATKEYDKNAIYETCMRLTEMSYEGVIVIKSTVEPETTEKLSARFSDLHFIHNPEFLSAATALEDFRNQSHIVLGKSKNCPEEKLKMLESFYSTYFPLAKISLCSSLESESMKIFCNCFYATKIQFFTEIYLLCEKSGCNYEMVKNMMLGNGWINPMHTNVPGNDGSISFGGYCFPKDTNALNEYMARVNTPHEVLNAVIKERNSMRQDHLNEK